MFKVLEWLGESLLGAGFSHDDAAADFRKRNRQFALEKDPIMPMSQLMIP